MNSVRHAMQPTMYRGLYSTYYVLQCNDLLNSTHQPTMQIFFLLISIYKQKTKAQGGEPMPKVKQIHESMPFSFHRASQTSSSPSFSQASQTGFKHGFLGVFSVSLITLLFGQYSHRDYCEFIRETFHVSKRWLGAWCLLMNCG